MIRLTNLQGGSVVLCDHCRSDIPQGSQVISLVPAKVDDGYVARNYSQGEIVLCSACTGTLGTLLSLTGDKRTLELVIHQEAA